MGRLLVMSCGGRILAQASGGSPSIRRVVFPHQKSTPSIQQRESIGCRRSPPTVSVWQVSCSDRCQGGRHEEEPEDQGQGQREGSAHGEAGRSSREGGP